MSWFECSKCAAMRKVIDGKDDLRGDHCWYCGTLVPWPEDELRRFAEELDARYGEPLTAEQREQLERDAFANSELGGWTA